MKESSDLLNMVFNNIVFQGRNKVYGAYYLRRKYSKRLLLAAILATTTFSGALVIPLVKNWVAPPPLPNKNYTSEFVVIEHIVLPPPPKREIIPLTETKPATTPKATTKAYVEQKVVRDDSPEKEVIQEDNSKLAGVNTSSVTHTGTDATQPVTIAEEPPAGIENAATPTEAMPLEWADEMPSFGKGEKELAQYLSKNLRYPSAAQMEKIEGLVIVTFIVDPTGKITDAKIVKSIGYGTDEEALRVVSRMPDWNPGKQNGRPVPVRFTLPIRFNLQR